MDFKLALHNILENALKAFNTGDYSHLDNLINNNIHFTAPAYENDIISEPAVDLQNKQDLFNYWKHMHSTYPFQIHKTEFLEIGKTSKFVSWLNNIHFIVEAEIHFDEYGKVSKIFNRLVQPDYP